MARPRQIDRSTILDVALEIADDQGLDAVTMLAVARRLAVTPMALYRHVDNKADLLDGLVERLLDELPAVSTDVAWDDQLRSIGEGLRATAKRHPTAFTLLFQRPVQTTRSLAARRRIYAALREGGVAEPEIERVERLVSTIALGFVLSEAAGRFRHHPAHTIDEDFAALQEVIRDLVDRAAGRPG